MRSVTGLTVCTAALGMITLAACGGEASSEAEETSGPVTLVMAGYQPEGGSAQADTVKWWMDQVEERTDGQVKFETNWGGSLLPAGEIFAALKDGRVDIGWDTSVYYTTLPMTGITAIPFVTSNQQAVAETVTQLYAEYDELSAEWHSNGMELLAMLPSDANTTASGEPITTLADYGGKSIRAVGESPAALQAVGANPVSINVVDLFESLERGVVDGYMNVPLSPAVGLGYYEVAPHVTHDGIGIYGGAQLAIALDTYEELPESVRTVMHEVGAEMAAVDAANVVTRDDESCDTLLENGGEVHVLSDDEINEWREMVGSGPTENWMGTASDQGVDAEAFYDAYHAILDPKLEGAETTLSGVQRCAERS